MWGSQHPSHFSQVLLACSGGDVIDTASCGECFVVGAQKVRAGDEQVVCAVDGSVAAGILLTGHNKSAFLF
jgi:hypothetical protein